MITPENLDLQIDRNIDGSFIWYTSGCRRLNQYEPHSCIKATAMSETKGRFNLLTVIPPDAAYDPDQIIDLVRRAALLNANFPDLIDRSYDEQTARAHVEESRRGGLIH